MAGYRNGDPTDFGSGMSYGFSKPVTRWHVLLLILILAFSSQGFCALAFLLYGIFGPR